VLICGSFTLELIDFKVLDDVAELLGGEAEFVAGGHEGVLKFFTGDEVGFFDDYVFAAEDSDDEWVAFGLHEALETFVAFDGEFCAFEAVGEVGGGFEDGFEDNFSGLAASPTCECRAEFDSGGTDLVAHDAAGG